MSPDLSEKIDEHQLNFRINRPLHVHIQFEVGGFYRRTEYNDGMSLKQEMSASGDESQSLDRLICDGRLPGVAKLLRRTILRLYHQMQKVFPSSTIIDNYYIKTK